MADQTDDNIEFIPSDEVTEAEPDGAEQGAVLCVDCVRRRLGGLR